MDFRWRAREHLEAARQLFASNDIAQLRYACLELRMCIEALAYDRLQAHLKEVSHAIMKKWTPRKVMEELLAADPSADKSSAIYFGLEEEYGVPAKQIHFLGVDNMFTMKWANAAHNALGSFLHVPTLAQVEQKKEPSEETIRKKIYELIPELDQIFSSTVFNVNFGEFHTLTCECGFEIARRKEVVRDPKGVICASCGAIYDYAEGDDGSGRFQMRKINYDCFICRTKIYVKRHQIRSGRIINCAACGAKSKVEQVYRIIGLSGAGEGKEE
jgi:hypothetical protein